MARVLIVGCGCHGRSLARELVSRRHVVRGTTRSAAALGDIAAAGAEAVMADPDRLATLVPALEHAVVVVLLLGTLDGGEAEAGALHGPRLKALLTKLLDTTVRGLVYESVGSAGERVLAEGAKLVRQACDSSRIPYEFLSVPRESEEWLSVAAASVENVLTGH